MSNATTNTENDPGGIPSRGTVLCVFQDNALVQSIEPAIARRGFALLRARSSMQGFWMAATAQPDIIITDIPRAASQSDYLLDCLQKNRRTRDLPVIALVDSLKQAQAGPTCLRSADLALRKTTNVDDILSAATELLESRHRVVAADQAGRVDRVLRVDAVFSEIGTPAIAPTKYGSVYRQRAAAAATRVGDLQQDRQSPEERHKFDTAHTAEHHSLSRTTEERIRRHLLPPQTSRP